MGATHFSGPVIVSGQGGADGNSLLFGAGSAASPATTATADKNFKEFRVQSTATSGDARGEYLRLYIAGAAGGGEALRAFTTISDVAAANAHGAHISLNFGTSGTVTGQGIASRNTLHIPATALASNVTMAALQAEIWSDASTSDPGGSTLLSFLRINNGGNATGAADVDDDAVAFDFQGFTVGDGNMIELGAPSAIAGSIKIRVGSTIYYLPFSTTASAT